MPYTNGTATSFARTIGLRGWLARGWVQGTNDKSTDLGICGGPAATGNVLQTTNIPPRHDEMPGKHEKIVRVAAFSGMKNIRWFECRS